MSRESQVLRLVFPPPPALSRATLFPSFLPRYLYSSLRPAPPHIVLLLLRPIIIIRLHKQTILLLPLHLLHHHRHTRACRSWRMPSSDAPCVKMCLIAGVASRFPFGPKRGPVPPASAALAAFDGLLSAAGSILHFRRAVRPTDSPLSDTAIAP